MADAKLSNRQPDKRFGDDPVASVSSINGQQEHLLLRFDTGSIPRHATVTSATLSLWRTNGQPASPRAHAVTQPWQEATVTWNGFGSAHESGVAELSSLVSTWVRRPASNHGLLLTQPEGKDARGFLGPLSALLFSAARRAGSRHSNSLTLGPARLTGRRLPVRPSPSPVRADYFSQRAYTELPFQYTMSACPLAFITTRGPSSRELKLSLSQPISLSSSSAAAQPAPTR